MPIKIASRWGRWWFARHTRWLGGAPRQTYWTVEQTARNTWQMAGRGMTIRKDTIPPPRARHCDINGSCFFLISFPCPSSNVGHDSAPSVEEKPSETVYKQPSQVGACHRTPPHHHCLLTLGLSAAPTPAKRGKRSSIRSAVMLFSGMPAASWLSPLRCIALPHLLLLAVLAFGLAVLACLAAQWSRSLPNPPCWARVSCWQPACNG